MFAHLCTIIYDLCTIAHDYCAHSGTVVHSCTRFVRKCTSILCTFIFNFKIIVHNSIRFMQNCVNCRRFVHNCTWLLCTIIANFVQMCIIIHDLFTIVHDGCVQFCTTVHKCAHLYTICRLRSVEVRGGSWGTVGRTYVHYLCTIVDVCANCTRFVQISICVRTRFSCTIMDTVVQLFTIV